MLLRCYTNVILFIYYIQSSTNLYTSNLLCTIDAIVILFPPSYLSLLLPRNNFQLQHRTNCATNHLNEHAIQRFNNDTINVRNVNDGNCGHCGKMIGLGVYISRIEENSVAERAGLRPGDTILEVNGTPFTSINHEEALKVSMILLAS